MANLEIAKWWQTIKISWSKQISYRMNFFLQIFGPAIVFFFVKYNLWSCIFSKGMEIKIQNYTLQEMIQYHVWARIVSLLGQGHNSMNLSEDIRLGKISTYLIYPFDFWQFQTASFIAFQGIQLLVTFATLIILSSFGIIAIPPLIPFLSGILITLWVGIFWFLLQFLTGLLAFWLEETWIIRVALMIMTSFLSGAIIPLEFFPKLWKTIMAFTPFPYLTYYPIKIYMGVPSLLMQSMVVLTLWGLIILFLNTWLWKKGLKMYSGAGM